MHKAIGMAEYQTVSTGIRAADLMVKTADVDIMEAQTVCPGKYIVLICGELSAVRAAVDATKTMYGGKLIDSFVLGNPDESIFPAIYGANAVENKNALGVLETFSAASINRKCPAYRAAHSKRHVRKVLYAFNRRGCSRSGGN